MKKVITITITGNSFNTESPHYESFPYENWGDMLYAYLSYVHAYGIDFTYTVTGEETSAREIFSMKRLANWREHLLLHIDGKDIIINDLNDLSSEVWRYHSRVLAPKIEAFINRVKRAIGKDVECVYRAERYIDNTIPCEQIQFSWGFIKWFDGTRKPTYSCSYYIKEVLSDDPKYRFSDEKFELNEHAA